METGRLCYGLDVVSQGSCVGGVVLRMLRGRWGHLQKMGPSGSYLRSLGALPSEGTHVGSRGPQFILSRELL